VTRGEFSPFGISQEDVAAGGGGGQYKDWGSGAGSIKDVIYTYIQLVCGTEGKSSKNESVRSVI
jgi:hypothetical protein